MKKAIYTITLLFALASCRNDVPSAPVEPTPVPAKPFPSKPQKPKPEIPKLDTPGNLK